MENYDFKTMLQKFRGMVAFKVCLPPNQQNDFSNQHLIYWVLNKIFQIQNGSVALLTGILLPKFTFFILLILTLIITEKFDWNTWSKNLLFTSFVTPV